MRWVVDRTGRFPERPFWLARDLDAECERVLRTFLVDRNGVVQFPVATDDLTVMIEAEVENLDPYADLSHLGQTVEGVTEFYPGRLPKVLIDRRLSADVRRENRYRTTLSHEYGHVRLHRFLWDFAPTGQLFDDAEGGDRAATCRRDTIITAPERDWMEWQAAYASGAFLMPVSSVAELVADAERVAGRVGSVQLGSPVAIALIAEVQRQFGVSEEAARVRLTKLGHLDAAARPEVGLLDRS